MDLATEDTESQSAAEVAKARAEGPGRKVKKQQEPKAAAETDRGVRTFPIFAWVAFVPYRLALGPFVDSVFAGYSALWRGWENRLFPKLMEICDATLVPHLPPPTYRRPKNSPATLPLRFYCKSDRL